MFRLATGLIVFAACSVSVLYTEHELDRVSSGHWMVI